MDDNKVAVLLKDLRSQFRAFGKGVQLVNTKIDMVEQKINDIKNELVNLKIENHWKHQQLIPMIYDLDNKKLDTEAVQIKRVK